MEDKSLYQTLLDEGTPLSDISNHYSDLYVHVTWRNKAIIEEYVRQHDLKKMPEIFRSNIEGDGYWYDIPFAYIPFWDEKMREKADKTY